MKCWWAFVKTTPNGSGFIRVTVHADNWFQANEMLKNLYGSNLMSSAALC